MKRNHFIIAILSGIVLFVSAGFINTASQAEMRGDIKVDEFSQIEISVPADVSLEIAAKHSLSIDASQDILDKIETKVENGTLIIKKKDRGSKIKGEIKITITSPDIEKVSLAGSGNVYSKKAFEVDELELKIAGSAKLSFENLKLEELEISVAGSGDVFLAGSCEEMSIAIAGSGKLLASDFQVEEFNGKISGSGNCEVFVTGELDATIAGSGNIKYKGSPQVNTVVSGSGKVTSL